MKKEHRVTRQEISQRLVNDQYFERGHLGVTIWQSLLTILAWMGVILPFVWLAIPFFLPKWAERLRFQIYSEGIATFKFLGVFFLIAIAVIAIFSILLTMRNNYRFQNLISHEVLHDEEKLATRREALIEFYGDRFGSKEFRESVRYYSVQEEQNIAIGTTRRLYKDRGVGL